jgi:hypothetical protein
MYPSKLSALSTENQRSRAAPREHPPRFQNVHDLLLLTASTAIIGERRQASAIYQRQEECIANNF